MRAGWNDEQRNAGELAQLRAGRRRVGDCRARTDGGAVVLRVLGLGLHLRASPSRWSIPVFGSGDVIEPEQAIERLRTTAVSGVLIGRGVLRNPWILVAGADDLLAGPPAARRHAAAARAVPARLHRSAAARGRRRSRGLPPLASKHRREQPVGAGSRGARPRALGDQQAARAGRLVHEAASTTARTCAPRSISASRLGSCEPGDRASSSRTIR